VSNNGLDQNDAELCARALVLALLAGHGWEAFAPPTRFTLSSEPRLLHLDEVVPALTRLSKPVSCKASIDNSIMSIQCRSLTGSRLLAHSKAIDSQAQAWFDAARVGPADSEERILELRGAGQILAMSVKAFVEFLRDYSVACSLAGHPPDKGAAARGVALLVLVRKPASSL
jgi:hypothetical protein